MLQLGWLENLLRVFSLSPAPPLNAQSTPTLKTASTALKLLNNQHGPAPLTRLMCTHFPSTGARWLVVGSMRAAPGLGSSRASLWGTPIWRAWHTRASPTHFVLVQLCHVLGHRAILGAPVYCEAGY